MTSRQSPTIGTSAWRFLEISAGSMSAWMTLASGANESSRPVTRSSNRAPSEMSRSLRCSAPTAATVPCMPGMPRWSGWLSGKAPRAIRVVTTGILVSSASTRSSSLRLGPDDAAADVQHRALGLGDQPGRLAHLLGVRLGHRAVAGQRDRRRVLERRHRLQRVLGDVDEDRAGPPGRGDVEGLGDGARDLVGIGDEVVVLGDRHRDAADVGLLERVGADRRARHLAGDRDDRHRVHRRVGERRDEVGRARATGGHADTDPAGRGRVPLRPHGRRPARGGPGCAGSGSSRAAGRTPAGSPRPGCRRRCRPPHASSARIRLCAPVICSVMSAFLRSESSGSFIVVMPQKNPPARGHSEGDARGLEVS